MDLNNFTLKSQEVIQQAQQIAFSLENQAIDTGHILKAIFEKDENVTPFLLKKLGVNLHLTQEILSKNLKSYSKVHGGQQHLSQNAAKMIHIAQSEAKKMKDEYVSIEHLLLGLLKSGDSISQILKDQGLSLIHILKQKPVSFGKFIN